MVVFTRTGGNNRADYAEENAALERRAGLEARLFEKMPGPDVIDLG